MVFSIGHYYIYVSEMFVMFFSVPVTGLSHIGHVMGEIASFIIGILQEVVRMLHTAKF